ncbi:WXG100 family type VII secretion target [Pedococcus dokdonensis]|nr:hypothetical protein [Pedococcus dokdonensis]
MNQPTNLLGADTDELRRLRQQMDAFVSQLQSVGTTTTQHLQSLSWHGRDQQAFLDAWTGQYQPSLLRTAEAVTEAGRVVEEQAADQDRVSGGAGSGGSQAAGTGAGTAAGAATGAVLGAGTGAGGATGDDDLGSLSRRYESSGNPGTVSTGRGDNGGVSYGTYQLSSRTGSASEFVTWLRREHPEYAERLGDARPGSAAFSRAWRETAAADATEFGQIQHEYIQYSHYEPQRVAVERALPGLNLEGRDPVVRDVLWSTAVQHRGATDDIFTRAVAGRDVSTLSDADLVRAVYAERGRDDGMAYFRSSSPAVRRGVVNRFGHEQADALARLGQ